MIIKQKDIKTINSTCGELKELYSSGNIDISHVIIDKPAKKHMHKRMEEVYYIANGEEIAKQLNIKLNFVPNAGHFNKKAGYVEFQELYEKIINLN